MGIEDENGPDRSMLVFTGNANPKLAKDIVNYLNMGLGKASVSKFSDGEAMVEIMENVRGRDVFVVQPTCAPTNDNLIEVIVMIDALRRASAYRITAVIPYFGYARQDKIFEKGEAISAKTLAKLISINSDEIITIDPHKEHILDFFTIPASSISAINDLSN